MTFARLRKFVSELPCTYGHPITSHAPGEAVAHEKSTRKEDSRRGEHAGWCACTVR